MKILRPLETIKLFSLDKHVPCVLKYRRCAIFSRHAQVAKFQQQLACERIQRGKQVDFVCKMHGFPQCVVKTSCKQSLILSKN